VHEGQGPGLSDRRLGSKFGAERVTLTENQMPSHRHASASSNSASAGTPSGNVLADTGSANIYSEATPDTALDGQTDLANAGGSQSHNNLMPFQCVNFIIALFGIYPSRN
jgi:microcystin-dependent protein